MIVTLHACVRYCERVDPSRTLREAEEIMLQAASAADKAREFGARIIKLGNGAQLILDPTGERVVTVLGKGWVPMPGRRYDEEAEECC